MEARLLHYIRRLVMECRYLELKVFTKMFTTLAEKVEYGFQFEQLLDAYLTAVEKEEQEGNEDA